MRENTNPATHEEIFLSASNFVNPQAADRTKYKSPSDISANFLLTDNEIEVSVR